MMLYRHQNTLRMSRKNGFVAVTGRLVATILIGLLLPALANAYTLVMRDGRWIEIPDRFEVTETTLTYETAPGILVTLQLTSIDVDGTDTANGAPKGSLLRRIGQRLAPAFRGVGGASPRHAVRTLTNLDLEQTRRTRILSEEAYEIRRKELGLPSREESDKIRQEESVRAKDMLARSEVELSESENYWRTRASDLRNEIFVVDSEISYLRTRLYELGGSNSYGTFATFGYPVALPYFGTGIPRTGFDNRSVRITAQPQTQSGGRVGLAQPQIRRGQSLNGCAFVPCSSALGVAYPYNYNSYDQSAILYRLRELEVARSGLDARWQVLEDEARRGGAQPGWLRP